MTKLMNTKILIAILVVLIGIAGGITWIVKDRQARNEREYAQYYKEMSFKADFLGKPVEQVIAEDKARNEAAKNMR